MPEPDCFLRYRIRRIRGILRWENPTYTYWRPTAAARHGFKMVLFTEPSKYLCRRYMRSAECPSSFIISYFGFRFTSAYNSILFCCLRRNVEPCCPTHDSRTTMTAYSAWSSIPAVKLSTKNPAAKCDKLTTVQQLPIAEPDIRWESRS